MRQLRILCKTTVSTLLVVALLFTNIAIAPKSVVPEAQASVLTSIAPTQAQIQSVISCIEYVQKMGALEAIINSGAISGQPLARAIEVLDTMKQHLSITATGLGLTLGQLLSKLAQCAGALALTGVLVGMQDWDAWWQAYFSSDEFYSNAIPMPDPFGYWVVNLSVVDQWVTSFVVFTGIEAAAGFAFEYAECYRSGWETINDWTRDIGLRILGGNAGTVTLPRIEMNQFLDMGMFEYHGESSQSIWYGGGKVGMIIYGANGQWIEYYDRRIMEDSGRVFHCFRGVDYDGKAFNFSSTEGMFIAIYKPPIYVAAHGRKYEVNVRSLVYLSIDMLSIPEAEIFHRPVTLPAPPNAIPDPNEVLRVYPPAIPNAETKDELEAFRDYIGSLNDIPNQLMEPIAPPPELTEEELLALVLLGLGSNLDILAKTQEYMEFVNERILEGAYTLEQLSQLQGILARQAGDTAGEALRDILADLYALALEMGFVEVITDAVNRIDENRKTHILQDKHNWHELVPDPKDPNNWGKIATIISTVLANGVEKVYKNGPAYIKSLEIEGKVVEVVYRIIDGVVRISDAWIQ